MASTKAGAVQYLGRPLDPKASLRPSTLPLELVSYEKSYNYVERTLIPWLSGMFALPETQLGTIKVCFQEIFNNIKDHSKEHIGCSFAQYFPGKKEVVIAISDFGVGIPANVEKVEKGLTDQRAIAMACNEGFTTQSTGTNRGAGLDVLIRNVVGRNKGTLIIYSRKGILSCTPGGALGSRTPRPARGFYPGTLLNLILKVDNELGDGEAETFSWTS